MEVIVAMVVGLIGLLGAGSITIMMVSSIDTGKRLSVGTTLGQERMEQISAGGYQNAIAASHPDEDYGSIAGNADFRRTVAIADATPEASMKTVTVTVSWIGTNGNARNVALDTILTQ